MSNILLARDQFREAVFKRDEYKCVFCFKPAKDAHHIIERRLFNDGGYYLDNGVSVCEEHHIQCEKTLISCEEIRAKIGVKIPVLPTHFYHDQVYDKWGNPVLENGQRLRGELFDDISVQAILDEVLHLFTNKVKYPRTHHLPWSPGKTDDDRVMEDLSRFEGKEVIVSAKMDGENTTWYKDYLHARSLEYSNHPSRNWVKALHAQVQYDIPDGWRICGENLQAKHSIKYENLPSYFMVFSIWNERNECLSWDETTEWAKLLNLETVPVLFREVWASDFEQKLKAYKFDEERVEGYVVRVSNLFHYKDFRHVVGKYVRKHHVQTHGHWAHRQIELNGLRK